MSKSPLAKYARFSGIALQMLATIYLSNWLGSWLDGKYPSESISYEKILTLIGVFGSMFSIIRQVQKLSKDDE